jgi:hypothetical protein
MNNKTLELIIRHLKGILAALEEEYILRNKK